MEPLKKLPEGTKLTVGSHHVTILLYLSEGGYAHIYKVLMSPKEHDEEIACLKRVIVPDKNGLDHLRKEVDVMKKLRHSKYIVRYYDSHAERLDSGVYQVLVLMELCPNKSLLDYMNMKIKTKLSEQEILSIMYDISRGIYDMHRMRLIHRDIKIENVLIDGRHRFKVCDFGSTSSVIMPPKTPEEFQALTHDITYQTTPQYRAPEMIDLYRGFAIDEKSDIWALGCFLYKLCYYTTPFEANGEIAILHASFQFPSAPEYSGDLKNLIIIMLQENPFFRPNIVQVIQLVCLMMKVDYAALKIQDIYELGPYDFQALHAYQQQRQQDMIKQQQAYIKQQQKQYESLAVPSDNVDTASEDGGEKKDADLTSFDEIGDIDDVEQRYPSLENIPVEKEKASKTANSASSASSAPPSAGVANVAYPVQPRILQANELQKLTPEQLQEYNYQHQAYQYHLNQWMYYQQQTAYQQRSQTGARKSTEFERKEAWEKQEKSADNEAEKLADDIFGSKSRSPSEAITKQKTAQSVKSEPVTGNDDLNLDVRLSKSNNSSEVNLKPNEHDEFVPTELDLLDDYEEEKYPDIDSDMQKYPDIESDMNKYPDIDSKMEKYPDIESDINHYPDIEADMKKYPDISSDTKTYPDVKADIPYPEITSKFQYPDIDQEVNHSVNHHSPPEKDQYNAFSTGVRSIRNSSLDPDIPVNRNPFPRQEKLPVETEKKDCNPWGNYRNISDHDSRQTEQKPERPLEPQEIPYRLPDFQSQAVPKLSGHSPIDTLQKRMDALSVADSSVKKHSFEEPNLIDLEVGLDSASSSSTPPILPSRDSVHAESLVDLDLDDKPRSDRPHFKKKISVPSDFKVQEEVVDWASDDEEHNSQMSRVSIRKSLRKLSRKAGEHKRSESSSGEKKRLSRLISS